MIISTANLQIQSDLAEKTAEDLDRRLSLLLSTKVGTMPLDRAFGINMDFLDMPPQTAKCLYTAEITKKIAMFVPEVRVKQVQWNSQEGGILRPKVVITSA